MKIGIDYHGVITTNPEFFEKFTASALSRKHRIVILSGGSAKDVENYLTDHKISFFGYLFAS